MDNISRSKIQNLIEDGMITVNGKNVKRSTTLKNNDKIIILSLEDKIDKDFHIYPEKIDLDILYEDDDILVINKQSGIVVHPGAGNYRGTLANGLKYYLNNSVSKLDRVGIVHRLDKETSGVMVIAKNSFSLMNLSHQFYNREVKKEYIAFTFGKIPNQGEIKGYLLRNSKNRKIYSLKKDKGIGRYSSTLFKRVYYKPPISIVNLYPITGRTHQLRAHLKSIGRPIISDISYSGGQKNIKSYHSHYTAFLKRIFNNINRVALHAYKLEITHPTLKKEMSFKVDMPYDMKRVEEIIKDERCEIN